MTSESLSIALYEPVQAHADIADRVWPLVKANLIAGIAMALEVMPLEQARTLKRNAEYWGYVLKPISEQAQLGGIGATDEGWHYYYKKMFLGYEFNTIKVPGQKRPSVTRTLRSTRKLSEKAMRKYCEEVRAHAATTFGVEFPAMPMDTTAPVKKLSRKRREVVDADGVITEVV